MAIRLFIILFAFPPFPGTIKCQLPLFQRQVSCPPLLFHTGMAQVSDILSQSLWIPNVCLLCCVCKTRCHWNHTPPLVLGFFLAVLLQGILAGMGRAEHHEILIFCTQTSWEPLCQLLSYYKKQLLWWSLEINHGYSSRSLDVILILCPFSKHWVLPRPTICLTTGSRLL